MIQRKVEASLGYYEHIDIPKFIENVLQNVETPIQSKFSQINHLKTNELSKTNMMSPQRPINLLNSINGARSQNNTVKNVFPPPFQMPGFPVIQSTPSNGFNQFPKSATFPQKDFISPLTGTSQSGFNQFQTTQNGTPQSGFNQFQTTQNGTPQSGFNQFQTTQNGTPQSGTQQNGIPQNGFTQTQSTVDTTPKKGFMQMLPTTENTPQQVFSQFQNDKLGIQTPQNGTSIFRQDTPSQNEFPQTPQKSNLFGEIENRKLKEDKLEDFTVFYDINKKEVTKDYKCRVACNEHTFLFVSPEFKKEENGRTVVYETILPDTFEWVNDEIILNEYLLNIVNLRNIMNNEELLTKIHLFLDAFEKFLKNVLIYDLDPIKDKITFPVVYAFQNEFIDTEYNLHKIMIRSSIEINKKYLANFNRDIHIHTHLIGNHNFSVIQEVFKATIDQIDLITNIYLE